MRTVPHWLIIASLIGIVIVGIVKWPEPELEKQLAIGTLQIPAEYWQHQLEGLGKPKGIRKLTRKEADPTSHAVAKGAAAPIVDRFLAAAVVDSPKVLTDLLAVDSVTGNPGIPTQPKDTVYLGLGYEQRRRFLRSDELKVFSVRMPGADGTIDVYHGDNARVSYESGKPRVNTSRFDVVRFAEWALFAAVGYASGKL